MEITYTKKVNIKLTVGSELPIEIDFLNEKFPVIESTCGHNHWGYFIGNKQGGINGIPVESISILHFPEDEFRTQRVALFIKWNNGDVAVVIAGLCI